MYVISKLDGDQIEAVRSMEAELGKRLIAISEIELKSDDSLTSAELQRLQALEEDLGLVLVAVKH